MPECAPTIVIYGLDPTLLQTRRWVLERSGYSTLTVSDLSQLIRIPEQTPISLLILCHSLDQDSCSDAIELADVRWPGVKHLVLARRLLQPAPGPGSKVMLGLDGPRTLIFNVDTLVGQTAPAIQ